VFRPSIPVIAFGLLVSAISPAYAGVPMPRAASDRRSAPASSAPPTALPAASPVAEDRGGVYIRETLGFASLRGTAADDGDSSGLRARAFEFDSSIGRRFRGRNALHLDFDLAIGPAPIVELDGESSQAEDFTFSRYRIGLGFTRFFGSERQTSLVFGVAVAVASLENAESDYDYDYDTAFVGIGASTKVAVGYDFYRGVVRLGLVGQLRFESYSDSETATTIRGIGFGTGLSMAYGR